MILTNGYWHRRFGAGPDVLNRVLTIDSRPHQIIGVMPAEFRFGGAVVNTHVEDVVSDIIPPLRINRAGASAGMAAPRRGQAEAGRHGGPGNPTSAGWSRCGRRLPSKCHTAISQHAIRGLAPNSEAGRRRKRGQDALISWGPSASCC